MSQRSRNLCKYVIPTVLSSVSYFLFTIVDGIFVGQGIGTNALGAINIAFPFVMIIGASFMLSTVGGVTITAIRFGEGDVKGANDAFMHSLTVTSVAAVVLFLMGTLLTEPLCRLLGANETFFSSVYDYVFWYAVFIIPSGISTVMQGFARNDGSPVLVSAAVIAGTSFNIFADWLFIFPLGMGLKGAAIATGISQTLVLIIILPHFIKKRGRLRVCGFTHDPALYKRIAVRGLPEFIAQLAAPTAIIATNYVLLKMTGDIGVNAFSIIDYVASFSVSIFLGTASGLQPMFGQCYGAKNSDDLKYYFRAGLIINIVGSIIIYLLLFAVSRPICTMFGADAETLSYTVERMPKYAWGFIVMSLNTIISAYLYSTKRSRQATIINLLRSFILDLAVIILMPVVLGAESVWFTFGVYELLVLAAAVILLRRSEKNGVVFI